MNKLFTHLVRNWNMPLLGSRFSQCVIKDRMRLMLQTANYHLTEPVCAGHIRNTKKKIIKPKSLKSKSKVKREHITVNESMTVTELAAAAKRNLDSVFHALEILGLTKMYQKKTAVIDDKVAIVEIFKILGYTVDFESSIEPESDKDLYPRPPPHKNELVKRPPVVTIMGHVDHGKTTLLDALRQSNVVDQEFGGITQHIGAFTVTLKSGEEITFLDTPGHAAFYAMRARGANVTDIIVLVVAADDGVMKQTLECIYHAQQVKVPIIVAINKIDKPEANIEATKTMLLQNGIELEEFGGDVQVVPISAIKKTNLDTLQEAIAIQAEMMNIGADIKRPVEACVIESKTDVKSGILSTALIQRGILKKGDILVAGDTYAKVRKMLNNKGESVFEVSPGKAVEILGWKGLPHAGEIILQADSEKHAQDVVKFRKDLKMAEKAKQDMTQYKKVMERHKEDYNTQRQKLMSQGKKFTVIYRKQREKEISGEYSGPELPIVIKGDVDGSVEAILDTLSTYNSNQCKLSIISYGVGEVSPQDIEMAGSFDGIVYAFNTPVSSKAHEIAKETNVPVYNFNIIYKMMDHLLEELRSRLYPIEEEEIIGTAKVLDVFEIQERKKKLPVAGCRCMSGVLNKNHLFRLVRDGEVLIAGSLESLRHFKSEVQSIQKDMECGLQFSDTSVKPAHGDEIVCYTFNKVTPELDWQLEY